MTRDLMHGAEIRQLVRDACRHVPATTAAVAYKLYSAEELADVPLAAIQRVLEVANHLRYADIQPGETIVDLGCGAGIDTILAARRIGLVIELTGSCFPPSVRTRWRSPWSSTPGCPDPPGALIGPDRRHSSARLAEPAQRL